MATPDPATKTVSEELEGESIDLRLYRACRDGNDTVIPSLLELGADPTKLIIDPLRPSSSHRNAYSSTSVHAAGENCHLKCLELLIETKNLNPNILDSKRQAPLHYACDSGHKHIVQKLLAHPKCIPTLESQNRNTPLHFACRNGHLECVKLLFGVHSSHSVDLNLCNKNKQTPIHYACLNGHSDIVKYLLTHAACKANTKNMFGYTPLHLACRNGHLECVKIIIEYSTVHIRTAVTQLFQTALHLACEYGRENVTEYLLTHAKFDPNIPDFCGNTPLHVASRTGCLDCVKLIIEQSTVRVHPNLTNNSKETALFVACEKGHKDIASYLLNHSECNPNIKNEVGDTILHVASHVGELEIVQLINEDSAVSIDPDEPNNQDQTALHLACRNSHKDIGYYLLSHTKCNPNCKDQYGNTSLHIATLRGEMEMVKSIFETSAVGIDVDLTNSIKQTTLYIACWKGHKDIVEYLLTRTKCDPSIQDIQGDTALHIACHSCQLQCVKLIVETSTVRVDPNLTNKNNQTALHLACENSHRNIAEYLLAHAKCNPNIQDVYGNTPLHICTLKGEFECVKSIFETSAVSVNPDVTNNNKQTALYIACWKGHKDIVEYLLTHAKCDPSIHDIPGDTALHIACHSCHLQCVKLIVETSTVRVDPNLTNKKNQTALHLACESSHRNITEYLLAHAKCNPNIQDVYGNTPLHICTLKGEFECVKSIFETSAVSVNPDVTNNNKQTALYIACWKGQKDIVEYLFTHTKCNPNIQDGIEGNTPLHIASCNGHMECVKLILETSTVRIDPTLTKNQTALHIACENGYTNIAEYLLTHPEFKPNFQDVHGNSLLHIVSRNGYLECVKLIIENETVRVNPDLTNKKNQTALHLACENSHRNITEYLLAHAKCNPNIQDVYGNTPLHICTLKGEFECVKSIFETSAVSFNPDVTNNNRQTALYIACWKGQKDIVEYLFTHTKCNPNIQDGIEGNTPLHIASCNGHMECVKLILETSTVRIDLTLTKNQLALHLACENGYTNIAEYLLTHPEFKPNFQDVHGNSLLHIVSRNGYLECVKLIIENETVRVNPDLTNKKNQTALHLACENSQKTIAEYLLTHAKCNPCIQDVNGDTPLHISTLKGELECVKSIFETSAVRVDPDVTNNDKQTALYIACWKGHKHIVEYLLSYAKCNPYIQDIEWNTPLHIACHSGHIECVKLIFESSTVSPDFKNNQTALHLACVNGHSYLTEYLLTHAKCNPNIQGQFGNTPLHIATLKGELEWVKLIFETSAVRVDPDVTNNDQQTALYIACWKGHKDIVEYLLYSTRCNPTLRDRYGNTSLHIASRNGHKDCVKLIIETSTVSVDPILTNISDNQTALHLACENRHRNVAEYLLIHAKCNPNIQDFRGNTPLHIVSRKGYLMYVKLIIETSTIMVDPNLTNRNNQTALHLACVNSQITIAEYLLTHTKCNPNIQDFHGNTPLHIATLNGQLECVKSIFETSALSCDPDVTNNDKQSSLYIACWKGHKHIVKYLLTHAKCDPSIQDIQGDTALHIASHSCHLECVKLILETSTIKVKPDLKNKSNQTVLHLACEKGCTNITEYLLTHAKCDPSIQDIQGDTALHIACHSCHLECVKSIFETSTIRVDPELTNKNKQTALHLACVNGHRNIAEYLLTHAKCNPNIQGQFGNTPLHIATLKGELEWVKLIFETSAVRVDPDATNNDQQTALYIACWNSHKDIIKYLLYYTGCNPTLRDRHGNTFLHIVCVSGHLQCVKLILESSTSSVDPNMTNTLDNQTALHLACENRHRNVADYLLTHAKCNPNIQDFHGNTPLHIATLKGELECIKSIFETSAVSCDPDVTNNDKQTALYIACWKGHKDIVEYLLTHSTCDPTVQNIEGNTPLHIASHSGHLECVKLIGNESVRLFPDLTNKNNQTALHLACVSSQITIAEYLLTHMKCNPSIQDFHGNTPLHIATLKGELECIKSIFETSAISCDPDVTNNDKQTALYIACWKGHKDIVEYLLTHTTCDPTVQNIEGNTPLHIASYSCHLECVKLIIENETVRVNPDLTNKDNQTALHLACVSNQITIAEYLLTHAKCNPSIQNVNGDTPLHIATLKGELECVKSIFETSVISCDPDATNNDKQTAVYIACSNGHKHIVKYLLSCAGSNPTLRDRHGNTPLHIAIRMNFNDVVKIIVENVSDIANVQLLSDSHGLTALHIACEKGYKDIVESLVSHDKCNPDVKDENGNTPLHIASKHGHPKCVQTLVTTQKIDLNEPNNFQQTALHLACTYSHIAAVNVLLVNSTCKPDLKDADGYTPLHYAAGCHGIIRLLIQHGADPQNVYKAYSKVLGKHAKRPPKSRTKVVITGDSGAGKTTLVEALKKEKSFIVRKFTPSDVVTEVEAKTAGIIPHDFESRNYGNVTFYDLAGHREYYSSHSAVLKSLTGTSLPTSLLVTDISKRNEDIKHSLAYWVNFFENQFPETTTSQNKTAKLPVIVVGSHLDKVTNSSSIDEKAKMIEEIFNFSDSIAIAEFIPMNCQQCESSGMTKLRQCLKVWTPGLQTQERMRFAAHCLHVYLIDKYQDLNAVSLSQVQSHIRGDREQNLEQDISYFLPESLYHLCKLCEDLNDRGIVLFLKEATNVHDSLVVMNKSRILSEINGTVFASDNLKQCKKLASCTGVVPVSKLEQTFPHYNKRMLVGVLQYFEFCHDVCDQLIKLIQKEQERDSTDKTGAVTNAEEHYLFFPSLVIEDAPNDLWEPQAQCQDHFGWIIQCVQAKKHFLPRFQSVLCNRLAFKFALAPDPDEIDPTIPALQRKCSVWKNGIYWGNRQGVESLIEVDSHCRSVVLLMRCTKWSTDFQKLRFQVIQVILKAAEEFCPKIKTAVSLIASKDITFPLKPVTELTSITLPEVITSFCRNSASAVSKDGKPISLESLIGAGRKIEEIKCFGSIHDGPLPQEFTGPGGLDERINHIAQMVGVSTDQLELPCQVKHLLPIAKRLTNWIAYTDYLELTPVETQGIQTDVSLTAPHQQPLEMLRTWHRKFAHSPKAHYRYLLKSCLEVGDDTAIAEYVCQLVKDHAEEADSQSQNETEIYTEDLSQRINQMARDVGIDPAILDQPYSRKHLLAISQKLTNWKAYTDYLGLSLVDEQAIQTNIFLTAPHQRPLEMLKTWMQRCAGTTKVHYRYLVKACLEVGGDTSLAGCVCRLANNHTEETDSQSQNETEIDNEDLSQRINQIARDVGIDPAILDQPCSRKHLLLLSQKLTNWKAYTDYLTWGFPQ